MRVLIACEKSGVIRRAFHKLGYKAYSCDIVPAQDGETKYHIQQDVLEVINDGWDLMIAHPECTYLAVSGIHWNYRGRNGLTPEQCWQRTDEAAEFFMKMADAPIKHIAIENPKSIMSKRWRKPDQKVQPHQFGHDASKETWLWLKNLPNPPHASLLHVKPRIVTVNGKQYQRWGNQTDSGQNRLGPSEDRSAKRAETYPGIATCMAFTWGRYVERALNDCLRQAA